MYWFSADYHLSHSNIIRYCNRPFFKPGDLDKNGNWISKEIANKRCTWMNTTIIRNHNARVKKTDIFIHNGDFNFKNTSGGKLGEGNIITAREWEEKLNGTIIRTKGNHENNNGHKIIIENMVIGIGGKRIFITHKPQYCNYNYEINFVGHSHNDFKFKRVENLIGTIFKFKYIDLINIGCDNWNFMPVNFNEIIKEYHQWKNGKINDKGKKI